MCPAGQFRVKFLGLINLMFKRETESLLIAARNNAIMTNSIKAKIDTMQQNSRCIFYGDWGKRSVI